MYRRPLPPATYGFLWYGYQRQPYPRTLGRPFFGFLWLSSLISFLLLTLLLLPWAVLSIFLATTFTFYERFSQLQYRLMRRGFRSWVVEGQTAALRFFSLIFFSLASLTLNFWGLGLEFLLAVVR